MQDIQFGYDLDRDACTLRLTVVLGEASAASLCLDFDEAIKLLEQLEVTDVYALDGKPCLVAEENGIIKFLRGVTLPKSSTPLRR
jgi:hypothetical protein